MIKPIQPPPYTWEEIEEDVRVAIGCQFAVLEGLGPDSDELLRQYLGVDSDTLDSLIGSSHEERRQTLRVIPLERHRLYTIARNAYCYAYQLEGWDRATYEDHYIVDCGLLTGFPQTDMDGEPSPLTPFSDFPLRRVLETFLARWNLYNPDFGGGLSVRELALLANMTVPAVRTSLSKEGLKLDPTGGMGVGGRRDDDRTATLGVADAMRWLERRRGFTPNQGPGSDLWVMALAGMYVEPGVAFDHALRHTFAVLATDAAKVATSAAVTESWLHSLAAGRLVPIDIDALRRVAQVLKLPEVDFVTKAVHHLISLETAATNQVDESLVSDEQKPD